MQSFQNSSSFKDIVIRFRDGSRKCKFGGYKYYHGAAKIPEKVELEVQGPVVGRAYFREKIYSDVVGEAI